MSKHVWEQKAQCSACSGTGVYIGFAERDGAAVECYKCKGTGEVTLRIEWEDFEGRKHNPKVKRVYQHNAGICIGEGNDCRLEDFGGMEYEDWLAGAPWTHGTEDREHTCPAWFYQGADYTRKPKWDECIAVGTFSSCQHFPDKAKCWERFDREFMQDRIAGEPHD